MVSAPGRLGAWTVIRRFLQRFRGGPPTALPGYTTLGKVREGSMSYLFKARDDDTGQVVAVKVQKPEARKPVDKLEAIYGDFTEGQITAAFDHSNVVKCFDHGDLGGSHFLVLEYLEGVTFASLMGGDAKRLDGRRIPMLLQAAQGLAHVHSRRFTHNDVCLKNVFVTGNDQVKLIDFGLATPLMNAPALRSRMGTVEFLAPDLLKREPCDHRADVFAWGVVAYEVLCGHWPFESPEQHQTLNKILNVRPVPLDRRVATIPAEVSNLVLRCLEKEPPKRLASINTAVGVLERHAAVGV